MKGDIDFDKIGIVYSIKNKYNGSIYIGETKREKETRFHEHHLALINGKERNKQLQKEFSELGINGFEFQGIIETKEHKLSELVLIELFSRIGIGYKQKRGDRIQKVISGEVIIPEVVFQDIKTYINQIHSEGDYHLQLLDELKDIKENGFQCKSDDIYNREFKNLFLAGYNHKTRRVDEFRFKKAGKFEKKEQKIYMTLHSRKQRNYYLH
ncbi:GIY-YIG nuclease family protein [Rossellomorea marisflavi]|uniref:GIY-YIG nuclease family protein n=1 Tax=Rossellomorea marisflavi TaxID=189381 RepID=UPI0039BF3941